MIEQAPDHGFFAGLVRVVFHQFGHGAGAGGKNGVHLCILKRWVTYGLFDFHIQPIQFHAGVGADEDVFGAVNHAGFYQPLPLRGDFHYHLRRFQFKLLGADNVLWHKVGAAAKVFGINFIKLFRFLRGHAATFQHFPHFPLGDYQRLRVFAFLVFLHACRNPCVHRAGNLKTAILPQRFGKHGVKRAPLLGFPKGDLSSVRAKTTTPMGAGPYKFIEFKDGVIRYERNDSYFLGAPKIKYINFKECLTEDDKINGLITGTIDITDPTFNKDTVAKISEANGQKDGKLIVGDKLYTDTVANLGYGYLGMNASVMSVGGNAASEESKALRKAPRPHCKARRQAGGKDPLPATPGTGKPGKAPPAARKAPRYCKAVC